MIRHAAYLSVVLIISCEDPESTCTYADRIAVESGCYDPVIGLRFVALGLTSDHTSLRWEIHVLDNLSNGWTPDDIEINLAGNETFSVPDSVVLDNIHVIVKTITDCDGNDLHSRYFSFVRIQSANCTIWVEDEI